jgi:hypothetical protein
MKRLLILLIFSYGLLGWVKFLDQQPPFSICETDEGSYILYGGETCMNINKYNNLGTHLTTYTHIPETSDSATYIHSNNVCMLEYNRFAISWTHSPDGSSLDNRLGISIFNDSLSLMIERDFRTPLTDYRSMFSYILPLSGNRLLALSSHTTPSYSAFAIWMMILDENLNKVSSSIIHNFRIGDDAWGVNPVYSQNDTIWLICRKYDTEDIYLPLPAFLIMDIYGSVTDTVVYTMEPGYYYEPRSISRCSDGSF